MVDEEQKVATLADIEAIEQIPFEERITAANTYEFLLQGAEKDPEKVALWFMMTGADYKHATPTTYKEFVANINRTANMLSSLGVRKGDVVSIVAVNMPQYHYAIWGTEAIGAIINPINPLLGANQMRDIMNTARTKVLFTMPTFPGVDVWEKVESIKAEIPTLENIIHVIGAGIPDVAISFMKTLGDYNGEGLDNPVPVGPQDIAAYFHTGGTTGMPKIAQHTHMNEMALAWQIGKVAGMSESTLFLCGLPLFHVNGVFVTGLAPFHAGGTVVLLTPGGYRDQGVLKNFWKIIEKFKATSFSGVPTLYAGLLQVPIGDADISSLEYAICGAAPMSVNLFTAFQEYAGTKIVEGYGLTEGTCVSTLNPVYGERRVGSVGIRLPYQPLKIAILDVEGKYERDAEVDEIGNVSIKGPNVFPGYLQEEYNKKAFLDDEREWFNTGDLGRIDADGYLWLTGRSKELIKRGGHMINPADIEDPLTKHPAVSVVAAIGKPDPHSGEVPIAYIQLKEGAEASEEELLEFAAQNIGERAAVPKEIKILDQLPMTAVGKIFKPALIWEATKLVYEAEISGGLGEAGELVTVDVGEDKLHGTGVHIQIKPAPEESQDSIEARLKDILRDYTIFWEVELV
jgi:fatty-acyl-CoA synthase